MRDNPPQWGVDIEKKFDEEDLKNVLTKTKARKPAAPRAKK